MHPPRFTLSLYEYKLSKEFANKFCNIFQKMITALFSNTLTHNVCVCVCVRACVSAYVCMYVRTYNTAAFELLQQVYQHSSEAVIWVNDWATSKSAFFSGGWLKNVGHMPKWLSKCTALVELKNQWLLPGTVLQGTTEDPGNSFLASRKGNLSL